MKPKGWSILLFILSLSQWSFPSWNGFLFQESTNISTGESRIVAAIFFVSAILLWYLKEDSKR